MNSTNKNGFDFNKVLNATKNKVKTAGISDFSEILMENTYPNPEQPRKAFENIMELAQNIREHGLIQPIAVVKKDKKFMIVSGERRYRAVQLLKLKTIKAHILQIDEEEVQEIALIENIQREDLTPFEIAIYVNKLSQNPKYKTLGDLAARLGKSASYVSKCKATLKLSETIQEAITEEKNSVGIEVLSELSRIESMELQEKLFNNKANREEIREARREEAEGTSIARGTNKKQSLKKVFEAVIVSRIGKDEWNYLSSLDSEDESMRYINLRLTAPSIMIKEGKRYKVTLKEI